MPFDFKKMLADKKKGKNKKGVDTGPSDKVKLFDKDKKNANS